MYNDKQDKLEIDTLTFLHNVCNSDQIWLLSRILVEYGYLNPNIYASNET